MNWKRVIDELLVIPKGKHTIQVLVATFDPCYDECSGKPKAKRRKEITINGGVYYANNGEPISHTAKFYAEWEE